MHSATYTRLHVGLDLDGVLADFTHGFLQLLAAITGRRPPAGYVQASWSEWHDYTPTEIDQAWQHIYSRTSWWETLRPLDHPQMTVTRFLVDLHSLPVDVSYITTRRGLGNTAENAHYQSLRWIRQHHPGAKNPQVYVARNADAKGQLAQDLGLHLLVDDYWVNLQAVRRLAPQVTPVLFVQPWNRGRDTGGMVSVRSLPELFRYVGARLPSFTTDRSMAGEIKPAPGDSAG